MNRFRGSVALALALLALSVPAHAASETVEERGTQFVDAQVDIAVGDSVTWVFRSSPGGSGHTVTFEDASLNSDGRFANCPGLLTDDCQRAGSPAVTRTFTRVGTFPYYCKVHRSQGMTGVVVVAAKATTSSSSATTSSTLPRASTTSSTARSSSTSSTTPTSRELATSSTIVRSTTTTADSTSVLLPGDAPSFSGDDANAAKSSKDSGGSDNGPIVLIVALLLLVAGGGGFLLWRLRPGRA